MPSMELSKLRSVGAAVLSTLPQASAGFGKVMVQGSGAALSRSTSAGSSLSDGRSSLDLQKPAAACVQKTVAEEESFFAADMFGPLIRHESTTCPQQLKENCDPAALTTTKSSGNASKALSLAEYLEERESIRSLKEYYEERSVLSCLLARVRDRELASSIGLPPGLVGLQDAVQPPPGLVGLHDPIKPEEARARLAHCNEEVEEANTIKRAEWNIEAPQFLPQHAQGLLGGNGLSFDQSEHGVDFSMQAFDVSGQDFEFCPQTFDISEQAFEQAFDFDASAQAFHGQVCNEEQAFNEATFDLTGQSYSYTDQPFEVETPWYPTPFEELSFADVNMHEATHQPFFDEQFFDEQFATADLQPPQATWDAQPKAAQAPILSTQPPQVVPEPAWMF